MQLLPLPQKVIKYLQPAKEKQIILHPKLAKNIYFYLPKYLLHSIAIYSITKISEFILNCFVSISYSSLLSSKLVDILTSYLLFMSELVLISKR